MAETKTTIPVEIKMGNAGTNDANLPAFKEGSIIFTKDTKKIYIDPVGETERIAVGGEVDLSGKQDTITDSTNLTVNNLIVSSVLSLGKNDSENPISIQGLVTNSKPIISISSASGEYPRISGVGTPTADNDAVNRGYLTTKYGSTYYDSTAKEFYLPGGTNLVIPNSQAGRLYIGSESSTSADFKIYVNDPLDDGKLIITNLKIPTNDTDAANKKYVDTKQDKLDYSTSLMINSISLGNYTSQPSTTLNGYNIAFFDKGTTDEPKIVISPNVDKGAEDPKLTFSSVSVAGYDVVLSGVADPIGDTDVVNKKYLIDYIDTNAQEKIWSDVQLPSISEGTVSLGLLIGNKIAFSDDSYENDIIISGIKNGVADNDAVNVSQFNTKQDKFATVTTADTVQTVKIGDTLSITTTPNLNVDTIKSTGVLELSGNDNAANSYVSLRKTKLGSSCDFDATQGYLRVRNDPLADDFAVNKKYVDDIKTELLNAITHPYTYDEDTKELTLIL